MTQEDEEELSSSHDKPVQRTAPPSAGRVAVPGQCGFFGGFLVFLVFVFLQTVDWR